ncbi:TlpA family protein disulfide reductase [Paenibacillus sp. TRM 82003]|nr:TlpA family protein disulfide reductase [Paenibacillus sp. TRM 82003]
MFIIQAGPFSLNGPLLLYFLFGFAGLAGVRLSTSGLPESTAERIRSAAFGASLLWLAVWKGSLFLFDFRLVVEAPASLLYFDGGVPGRLLATASAVAWFFRSALRGGDVRAARLAYCLGLYVTFGYAAYRFGHALFGRASAADPGMWIAVVGAALLVFFVGRDSPRARRLLLQSLVLFGAALLLMQALGGNAERGPRLQVGAAAPAASLQSVDGAPLSIPEATSGRTTVLNFWATWCPPCRAEMPSFDRLYRSLNPQETAFFAVNLTATENDAGAAARYAAEHGLALPVALDPDGAAMRAYGVRAYPTTVLLDARGNVAEVFEGAVHASVLERAIRRVADAERSDP